MQIEIVEIVNDQFSKYNFVLATSLSLFLICPHRSNLPAASVCSLHERRKTEPFEVISSVPYRITVLYILFYGGIEWIY